MEGRGGREGREELGAWVVGGVLSSRSQWLGVLHQLRVELGGGDSKPALRPASSSLTQGGVVGTVTRARKVQGQLPTATNRLCGPGASELTTLTLRFLLCAKKSLPVPSDHFKGYPRDVCKGLVLSP